MYIDLTTIVSQESNLVNWAKSQENPYVAMGHVGTHLDTYEKTHIPLEYFKSCGLIFDVRGISEITPNDIDLNLIRKNEFVIFRTGRIKEHAYGEKEYFKNHPQLSHELIHELIKKEIRFIGIDCPGIRQNSEHEDADRLCENHNIYVIENLRNLEKMSNPHFMVYTMWLDDEIMTGLKCRVIAEYSDETE